jgi:hypothetical protein
MKPNSTSVYKIFKPEKKKLPIITSGGYYTR